MIVLVPTDPATTPPAAGHRVMRSHLVEFVAPGSCGLADALRAAATWLDEHTEPTVLALTHSYDEEADQTELTLVVQAFHDEGLEAMTLRGLGAR